jgi:hypothetical protein
MKIPIKRTFFTIAVSCLLLACKPTYPAASEALPLTPTISADGKLLAVLDRSGEETPRLRIKWLDRQEPWLELPAPKYTNSIRFGLTGYELLLTHARPGPKGASQLSRWDASNPSKPSEILYEGARVTFPVEVKPGQVLIRMCSAPVEDKACEGNSSIWWALVEGGKATTVPGSRFLLYSQPNIAEGGFFWLEDEYSSQKRGNKEHREMKVVSLEGGKLPQFDISRFDSKSRVLQCDRKASRCLNHYLTDERINGSLYVYGFKAFEGANTCDLPALKGWHDKFSVTPDGRAAVISRSRVAAEPRHVVVLRFVPGQCEPASIEPVYFEETQK